MSRDGQPTVAVIVPVYNHEQITGEFLDSFRRGIYPDIC